MKHADEQQILGVDPSFNRSGWALLTVDARNKPHISATGVIKPGKGSRDERLLQIGRQFEAVLRKCRPNRACFEKPGAWQRRGGSRRETVEMMGMGRGVMFRACAEFGVAVDEVDFNSARRAIIGTARVDLPLITRFIEALAIEMPRRPRGGLDLDIANAIVVGFYGLKYRVDSTPSNLSTS